MKSTSLINISALKYAFRIWRILFSLPLFIIVGLMISNGSKVWYSQATIITIFCAMRFDQYPLDTQVKLFSNIGSVLNTFFPLKVI